MLVGSELAGPRAKKNMVFLEYIATYESFS
jgi:hypothetical protein